MNLGQNIYELRTAKNLSQGNLADLLDVSRQSVSKWETDAAIPDLDKLVRMCDVFGVTLDELTGRTPQEKEVEKSVRIVEKSSALTPAKIVGYILLAVTIVASILLFTLAKDIEDFYIPFPLILSTFVCSLICLCGKSNIGYWCTWAALAPVVILSFSIVGLPILTTTGIMQIIVYVAMTIIANKKFTDHTVKTSRLKSILLIAGFIVGIAVYIGGLIFAPIDWIGKCIVNYTTYSVLAILLTYSVCYIRTLKSK